MKDSQVYPSSNPSYDDQSSEEIHILWNVSFYNYNIILIINSFGFKIDYILISILKSLYFLLILSNYGSVSAFILILKTNTQTQNS